MSTREPRRIGDDTGRAYVAVDRVSRILSGHNYDIKWNDFAGQLVAIVYYRNPQAAPGKLGYPPVWEVHFARESTARGWRFACAIKRMSSGDGRNDFVVNQVGRLAEAAKWI